eukprot:5483814-Ditylum_brightwellii.AAC.2
MIAWAFVLSASPVANMEINTWLHTSSRWAEHSSKGISTSNCICCPLVIVTGGVGNGDTTTSAAVACGCEG